MDFDDYVRHMTQKYSIAVAIAILKSKPENTSTQEYIEILKNKIKKDNKMDIDDVEICSDDFNFDIDETFHNDAQFENANDSVTILENFELEDNGAPAVETNSMNDVLKLLRDVDEETEAEKIKNSQSILPPINGPTTSKDNNFDITKNFSLNPEHDKFYETEENMTNENSILINKNLADAIVKNLNKHNITNINSEIEKNTHSSNNEIIVKQILNKNQTQILENSTLFNTQNFTYHEKDKMIETITKNLNINSNNNDNIYIDSQETIPYTLHGYTQNYTHVSQSQTENMEIGEQFIYGSKGNNKEIKITDKNTTEIAKYEGTSSQVIDITNVVKVIENNGRKFIILNGNKNNTEGAKSHVQTQETEINSQLTQDIFDEESTKTGQLLITKYIDDMEEDPQSELVPFKIIEELNKVRSFVYKTERRSSLDGSLSDSGYRSDSQSRSSYKTAITSSDNWINQSAYSLLQYLTQCPLVATTGDIVNEIAVVLGTLIDKLHEDEKYPSFLEEILDNIDALMKDVFEGDNSDDNVLITKDEIIQRIHLLNKSVHILKYTIEKITQKLQKLHSNLTQEDNLFELTNVDETENACYIFHLLETLLKLYMKVRDKSLSTQTSQDEDKILKKSSITDIWRKKWNPNYKEVGHFESSEKKCVLINCSEVLNKIIVDCMSGYSLIAFSALQCFNLMQS